LDVFALLAPVAFVFALSAFAQINTLKKEVNNLKTEINKLKNS
jgi:cell division protein FtsB